MEMKIDGHKTYRLRIGIGKIQKVSLLQLQLIPAKVKEELMKRQGRGQEEISQDELQEMLTEHQKKIDPSKGIENKREIYKLAEVKEGDKWKKVDDDHIDNVLHYEDAAKIEAKVLTTSTMYNQFMQEQMEGGQKK